VKLRADGLIIHVNPLQEWFQPEGDRFTKPPIETIAKFLQVFKYAVIVKEVGQGMGYYSLKALLELPLLAVEFAAFGGTNFAKMELMRSFGATQEYFGPLAKVGHDAYQMTELVNLIVDEGNVETSMIIISGGIKNFLDGYYLINRSKLPAIYGQASGFLKYATENYDSLRQYIEYQIKGLELAYAYLKIRD
jgi:isopentenyl-diphosphate delta-isomerase